MIVKIDPTTGIRTEISGPNRGSGPLLGFSQGVTLDKDGTLLVSGSLGDTHHITRVDPETGNRMYVSRSGDPGSASGPFVGEGYPLGRPFALSLEPSGNTVLAATESGVVRVDLVTGDRTLMADLHGFSIGVLADPAGGFLASDRHGYLSHFDPETGEHTTLLGGEFDPPSATNFGHLIWDSYPETILLATTGPNGI